jgi:replication factor A1|tara:strand:+ start:4327 stop:5616 length:1290 start_codon:yes stop_codon:yes gene_type:complete
MDLEDIVSKIVNETEIGEEEIREKINLKQKELGGLVTSIGAAHIVANEVGVDLLESFSTIKESKIDAIIPNMSSVDVVGRVIQIFPSKEFNKSDNTKGRVLSVILADETGNIRVVFWGSDVLEVEDKLNEDDILRIKEGYTKENINGEAEIHIGVKARTVINPKDVNKEEILLPEHMKKKIIDLKEGMSSINVFFRVIQIYEVREFERENNKKGKVVNLVVRDETGVARLVLWDDDVGLVEKGKIKVNDLLSVKKGYVKMRYDEPEINVGRYGKIIVNPPEEDIVQIPEIQDVEKVERWNIADLKDGQLAEIRGTMLDIYDNITLFDRKDGKGMVVNGVIDDGTANMRAAFYDKMSEALLNITLAEADSRDITDKIQERKRKLLGREIIATVRVKYNDFTGRNELIVKGLNINPDPIIIGENLLKDLKS